MSDWQLEYNKAIADAANAEILKRFAELEQERDELREALEQIVPLTDVHEAFDVSALHSVIRDICNIARAALENK